MQVYVENIHLIRDHLRRAVKEFNDRGLQNSAKWAAEQLAGLRRDENNNKQTTDSYYSYHTTPFFNDYEADLYLFAKSLFDSKEYQRCAHYLSTYASASITPASSASMKGNNNNNNNKLSAKSKFLQYYALYLAGEKRKEEEILEMGAHNNSSSGSGSKNTLAGNTSNNIENKELKALYLELHKLYEQSNSSSSSNNNNGGNNEVIMDGFLLYIYGIVLKQLDLKKEALDVLAQSVLRYPLLWASWTELSSLCTSKEIVQQVEHYFATRLNQAQQQNKHVLHSYFLDFNLMKMFFTGQVQLELQQPEAYETYSQLQKHIFPHSIYLQAQIAIANYNNREFTEAQEQFEQIRSRDPYRLDNLDTFSNILYVKEEKSKLSYLAHTTYTTDKYRPETCCIVGNYYSLKGDHAKAVMYFKRALKLDNSYLSAWTLMGHEYLEMKNVPAAVYAYRRAVDINPRDYRAWYGIGQTYEMLTMPLYALFYFRKATSLRPYDGRMWRALADCYEKLNRYPEALRCYKRAKHNNEPEGVALGKMAALYRQLGDELAAADCYLKLVQQKIDDDDPADKQTALLFLATFFKNNNKYDEAEKYCIRLLDMPEGQEKDQAKALLREIRSLSHNSTTAGGANSSRVLSPVPIISSSSSSSSPASSIPQPFRFPNS